MADKETKFTKEQILSSKQFTTIEKDIISAMLEEKEYSIKEVRKIIEDFKKKEVK